MKENRNKENLQKFEGKARRFIESPGTEKMNGSYETPAYFQKEKDGNLVAIATDNSFITVVNATQLKSIQEDHNFGLDTRHATDITTQRAKK